MVDDVRVLRLRQAVRDDLAFLRRESAADDDRRRDEIWLRGVKYGFVTAVEACVDVGQHLCTAEGWGPPQDNGDVMTVLGRRGVLPDRLAREIRRAVGFRHVLVHEYVAVDDTVVVNRLADLTDLEQFVVAVSEWLPSPTS